MKIRKYKPRDEKSVRLINFESGFFGNSLSKLLSRQQEKSNEINYYLKRHKDYIHVLVDNKKVVGYVLGNLNPDVSTEQVMFIFLRFINAAKSIFFPKKDRDYWFKQLELLIKIIIGHSEEINFKHPKNAANVHINILPKYRKNGYGSKLLSTYLKQAKKEGIKTVHADTWQTKKHANKGFWIKNGFKSYSKVKTILWEPWVKDDVYVECFYKEL